MKKNTTRQLHTAILLCCIGLLTSATASAQHITFEPGTDEYRAVGVYDTWEDSPFRTGALSGADYVQVVENPDMAVSEVLGTAPNPSQQVLAVQRSRLGSNTFGARIDLNEPLCLGTTTRYVHVMMHRPAGEEGRVMLIALGKRQDWPAQRNDVEQLWVKSTAVPTGGQWTDLVFPISTNEHVELHSLVVVPDLESPHLRTEDFTAYIDDILVDDSPMLRFQQTNYPVNFDPGQAPTRTDRKLTNLSFNVTGETGSQSVGVGTSTVYQDLTQTKFIKAKAGSSVTVRMAYAGSWMSGYAYVDWNNDGQFSPSISNNVPAADSELLAFTHLNGYNSLGESVGGNNVANGYIACPAFTIPANTPAGVYRMRLKVDWDSEDAGGNTDANNLLVNNGGAIVDVLLNVHEDNVRISANQLNGDVLTTEGTALSDNPIPFGKAFKIMMAPAPGFTFTGAVVRHGYGLDGSQFVKGNMQFKVDTIPAKSFSSQTLQATLPAAYINGEVRIEGLFTPDTTPVQVLQSNQSASEEGDNRMYSLSGQQLSALPSKGIYIRNSRKQVAH